MRQTMLVVLGMAAVAGCDRQSDLEKATADYEYLRRQGASSEELCDAARKAKTAAVAEKADDLTYVRLNLDLNEHCNLAPLAR